MSGLPLLQPGDSVKMLLHPDARHRIPGVIEAHHNSPRSYVVRTANNVYQRNRLHLCSVPPSANVDPLESQPSSCSHVSPDVNDVPAPVPQWDTPVENGFKSPSPSVQASESWSFPTVSSPRATASPRNVKSCTPPGMARP